MPDFWRDSGFHLLERGERGHLVVTDDLLRAYLKRPEVAPVTESCAAERELHQILLDDPRASITPERLELIDDGDARENYRVLLAFRDRLVSAKTVEECYLRAFLGRTGVDIPPLFIDQMAHVILRGILDGTEDGLKPRSAELFFREQAVVLHDGAIMLADAETVEMYAAAGGFGSLAQLLADADEARRTVELDVLDGSNANLYWGRDTRYDTVLNFSFAGAGRDAFCRVLEAWVAHFLDVEINVQPVQKISDEKWVWHVGLDAEGSRLLNDLYEGIEVSEERMERLLALFRLEFADPAVMLAKVAGRPVYLALCMTRENKLRLKPQNLLVNLPLAERG